MSRTFKFYFPFFSIRTAIVFLFLSFFAGLTAQVKNISGVLNTVYTSIDSIHSRVNTNPDTIFVKSTNGFAVGDTVLVYQTAGASIYKVPGLEGYVADIRNTGRYGIYLVNEVDPARKMVVLNTSLLNYSKLVKGESGQLVKVPTFKKVNVSGTLTCDPYNPSTGTGGVLVMLVEQSLTLNADIDVSGKGFPGADPGADEYAGSCSSANPAFNKLFYNILSSDSAAKKGYGIFDTTFRDLRGRCFATIGGGGGNGLYSGGGGGGHYSIGGKGGIEGGTCGSGDTLCGFGGRDLSVFLNSTKIFMGGGGGTGTQKPSQNRFATRGGAGGGVIIIVSDTIIGNGQKIMSQGESVAGLATAGAGGGGAGGSIFIHAFKYNTNGSTLTLDVRGGKGGDVSTATGNPSGPGGGGSGGVIWYNGTTPIPASYLTTGGLSGRYGASSQGAENGGWANQKNNLQIQIRGFLFNKLPDDQTICQNETPLPLNAPPAAGGRGTYTYLWQQSANKITWSNATGVNTNPQYVPGALTDTVYYRRIVDDGLLPKDTSLILTIFVHKQISNNTIKPDTVICRGLTANSIYAPLPVGGGLEGNTYVYKWELSDDNSIWTDAPGINNDPAYNTPVLTSTTYYRRLVSSGACKSTSNSVRVNVLELLSGNTISADQIICNNQVPEGLKGSTVSGGQPGDRSYRWQANSSGTWTDIASTANYNPPALNDTIFYRRIVYSGLNNTCKDTSNQVVISVLKDISNNYIINSADSIFCAGLVKDSLILKGSQPAGGNSPHYTYVWQKRPASQSVWTDAEITSTLKNYNSGVLYDTTYFRRLVFSGENDVCKDTSSAVLMKVLPQIGNNNISAPQVICALETPERLSGSIITGGSGQPPGYLWQRSSNPSLPESWENATGVNNTQNYFPPALSSTIHFRRIITSGPPTGTCRDTSASLKIEVQADITNNAIINTSPVYTCYNSKPALLTGTTRSSGGLAGGDESVYSFLWLESTNGITWNPASQDRNNADYQAEALTSPRYYRRYVLSGACKDTSAMVKIDTTRLPVLFALSAENDAICYFSDQPYSQLNFVIKEGHAPYRIDYSDGQGGSESVNMPMRSGTFNPFIDKPNTDSVSYTYTIDRIIDVNGCEATAANLGAFSVPVKVFAVPDPYFAAKLIEICDSVATISPQPSFGTPQWEYIPGMSKNMHAPEELFNTSIGLKADFSASADFSSEAMLVYREYAGNCNSRDSVKVIFYKNPQKAGDIYRLSTNEMVPVGDTLVIFISDNQDLKADEVSLGTPTWKIISGPAELTSTSGINSTITGLEFDKPSILEFSVVNGVCPSSKKTVEVLRKDLTIYEGFSPNDDGVNDVLYAKGLNDEEIQFRIQLFSSSGSFIREITRKDLEQYDFARNEVVLWDGTTKIGGAQEKVPDGTYYYVLIVNYKGHKYDKKGYIVVKR